MATMKKPVVHDDTNHVLTPLADGQVLEPSAIPVSTVDGNVLAVEEDGLAVTAESLVSDDAGNRLIVQDGKLMVEPETVNITVVSDDEGNLITAGSDHGAFLARERMQNFVNNLIDDALEDVVIVSKDADNVLTKGDDGGAYFGEAELDTAVDRAVDEKLVDFTSVSKDDGNLLRSGSDGGAFADGNDLLSNGDVNLLTINEVDKKIILTRDAVLTVTADELIKGDDLVLKDEDGKIVSELCISYDEFTGTLSLTGVDGKTVCTTTVPSQTASLKSVEFVTTKADASGEDVEGVYTATVQLKDSQVGWLDPVEVKVRTKRGTAGSFNFEMDTDEECSGLILGTVNARAWFNGQSAAVSAYEAPISFAFDDGSLVQITSFQTKEDKKGYTGSGTLKPEVGISTGAWLRFVFRLYDGGICEMYVDVAYLIDVYTAGNGIDITSNVVSAKAGTGITVDENGVQVDQDWFDQNVGDIIGGQVDDGTLIKAGNGITVATASGTATVSAKAGTGVTVNATGINVDASWLKNQISTSVADLVDEGDLIEGSDSIDVTLGEGKATVEVNEEWLKNQTESTVASLVQSGSLIKPGNGITVTASNGVATVAAKAGTGITVDSNGINVAIDSDGGLVAGDSGLYVDFDSMPTDRFETLLKSIRVPIWLTRNKSFYVNGTTGSDDTKIEGIGESQDKPFKTIQACVSYVTDNYNISSYTCTIYIAPGTYEETVTLPNYNRTTGSIVLTSLENGGPPKITNTGFEYTLTANYNSLWYLRNLIVESNVQHDSERTNAVYVSALAVLQYATVNLQRVQFVCNILASESYTHSLSFRCINVASGATVYWRAYNNDDMIQNKITVNRTATEKTAVLGLYINGHMEVINGTSDYSDDAVTVYCSGEYSNFANISLGEFVINSGQSKTFVFKDEGVTGRRYNVNNGGRCLVQGQGAEYFPGTTVGIVDTDTYCWYN